jgi:hypothetical protein
MPRRWSLLPLSSCLLAALVATTECMAGAVYLTGQDPDYHAVEPGGLNQTGARNINKVAIEYIGCNNPFKTAGSKFLLVVSDQPAPVGYGDSVSGIAASGPYVQGVDFEVASATTLNSQLDLLGAGGYYGLVIASDYGGNLRQAELDILNSRAFDITKFIGNGGGLYAIAESNGGPNHLTPDGGWYNFLLPCLVPDLPIIQKTSNTVTSFGQTLNSCGQNLVNTDVEDNPTHVFFQGAACGLQAVETDPAGRIISLAGNFALPSVACPSCAIRIPPCINGTRTAWVSLPTTSYYRSGSGYVPIKTAEDLCTATALPTSPPTKITRSYPNSTNRYTWQCGSTTSTGCSGTGVVPEPGCGLCFCIHPGEGYEIETTGSSTLQIYGKDDPVDLTYPGGQITSDYTLISLPCQSTLMTAQQFLASLGMGLGQGQLSRLDACTGAISTVPAGTALDFNLVPGEALRLRKTSAGNIVGYQNPVNPAPVNPPNMAAPKTTPYCVTGQSNSVGWSWWIDEGADAVGMTGPPDEPFNLFAGPIPFNQGPSSFVSNFVSDINSLCPGIAKIDLPNGNCSNEFSITAPTPFDFLIGAQGGPLTCTVTSLVAQGGSGGCQFNPLIFIVVTSVPVLGWVGASALALLLLSGALVFLTLRRGVRLTGGGMR